MRTRDSQRQRIYDMGSALPSGRDGLSLTECAAVVFWAWQQYGMTGTPRIADGRRRRSAAYLYDGTITLPRIMRNERIVLHEAAHSIIDKKIGRTSIAAHGPEFARVYTDLLVRRKLATASRVRAAAKTHRVRIARARAGLPRMAGRRATSRIARIREDIAEHEKAIAVLRGEMMLLRDTLRISA